MSKKKLLFVIVANQGYIHNINSSIDFDAQNNILFSAISETYIPLLNMFSKLEAEKVSFKVGVVISPALCALLDDSYIIEQFDNWLDRRIALGKAELKRCKNDEKIIEQVKCCLEKAEQDKNDFNNVYHKKLLEKFKYFADKKLIELIPTAATFAYLPHYADLTEILNAQIETGLYSHKHYFGETGDGFYLPYCGWSEGIDKVLRAYGVNYTFVSKQAVLFSKTAPQFGCFVPVRSNNSLVLFANDSESTSEISGENGYCTNPVYRNKLKDAGFDLAKNELSCFIQKGAARIQSGYKYFSNESDSDNEVLYSQEKAEEQVSKDAESFFNEKNELLEKASKAARQEVSLVCEIPAEYLGQNWFEGISWLEKVLRLADKEDNFETELPSALISNQFTLQKIIPYPCAENGNGYAEDLLDETNSWMMRYIRKASERMIDLTERFPSDTGLKARFLNLGAKELLLAQSSDWAKMLHDEQLPEYVTKEFKKNINSFTTVFDSLGSNSVSTEWLTEMEKNDSIFPWMNYRIFSRKK